MMREEILAGVRRLEELLDSLPVPLGGDLKNRLAGLRQLLFETRAPRFVLVGRRGAGKSSLVNAIFGQHVADLGHVAEGVPSAAMVLQRARAAGVEMPITAAVAAVLAGEATSVEALEQLMGRGARPEH